jgi:thioredoxin reductase (NADPH)
MDMSDSSLRDITVIGAGPAGMYAVFCAAMQDLSCHLVDALPELGGQLAALYPDKPIYDLPGFPDILAGEFCEHLKQQMQPAQPNTVLGERVVRIDGEPGAMRCHTESGRVLESMAVLLAGGKGAFKPRRPGIDGIDPFEGKSIFLSVPKGFDWMGRRVVVQGGGDSALDWAVLLVELGAEVTLVHRRNSFRAHPRTVSQFRELAEAGKARMLMPASVRSLSGDEASGRLQALRLNTGEGEVDVEVDIWLPLLGVLSDAGPMRDWGLDMADGRIPVESATMATSRPGIHAIGDLVAYAGKYDLLVTGFAEAAVAARALFSVCRPGQRLSHEFSTHKGIPHMPV